MLYLNMFGCMRSVVILLIAAARIPPAAGSRHEHAAVIVNKSVRAEGQSRDSLHKSGEGKGKGSLESLNGTGQEEEGSTGEGPRVPEWLPDAVTSAHEEFFSIHYPPAPEGSSESLKQRWAFEWYAKCHVNRPNHGIINAIRKTALIPVVANAYKTYYAKVSKKRKKYKLSKRSFDFSDEEIKAMQMGILYESAGRMSEIGWTNDDKFASKLYFGFRDTSFAAFRKYSKGKVNDKARSETYKGMKRMYMSPLSSKSNAIKKILEKVHDLELIRCFGRTKLCGKIYEIVEDLGMNAAIEIVRYSHKMIEKTGDRIKFNPIDERRRDYVCKDFGMLGRRPAKSLEVVYSVPLPEMPDPDAEPLQAPTKCFKEGGYEATAEDEDEDNPEDDSRNEEGDYEAD